MSKELNIIEASKIPNAKFKVIATDSKGKLIETIAYTDEYCDMEQIGRRLISHLFVTAKFIPIQKPVSFMEALKEYSEHKKAIYSVTGTGTKRFYRFDKDGLNSNGEHISAFEILDCDWYIEEEN